MDRPDIRAFKDSTAQIRKLSPALYREEHANLLLACQWIEVLEAQVAHLEARIKELETANEWKPIETIPETNEDNTVDIYVEDRGRFPNSFIKMKSVCFVKWVKNHTVTVMIDGKPTHWRPLPAPPEPQS